MYKIGAFFALAFLFANCSPLSFPEGNFQETPIIADGNSVDWGLPLRFGTEDGALQYSITNDNQNIYISAASNNRATQMRILRAGISFYIDVKGKKNKKMGVVIVPNNNRPRLTENRYMVGADKKQFGKNKEAENFKKQGLEDMHSFSTIGFVNMENKTYDFIDTSIIKVGIDYDAYNNLVVEAVIPLNQVYTKQLNTKNAPSLSVGIVVNSMRMNAENRGSMGGGEMQGRSRGGGMRGGGMGGGGMSGGGMRGGGMGGNAMGGGRGGMGSGQMGGQGGYGANGGRMDLSSESANWYQFKIALHK